MSCAVDPFQEEGIFYFTVRFMRKPLNESICVYKKALDAHKVGFSVLYAYQEPFYIVCGAARKLFCVRKSRFPRAHHRALYSEDGGNHQHEAKHRKRRHALPQENPAENKRGHRAERS